MHDEVPAARPESGRQWAEWIFNVPGLVLRQWAYISIYLLPSVTIGAVFAYAMTLYGRPMVEIPIAMFVGMSSYLPFVTWYFRPEMVVERKSKLWDRWYDQKIITGPQRKALKRELNNWYAAEIMRSLPRSGKLPSLVSTPESESTSAFP
jgi:hypothetical protein